MRDDLKRNSWVLGFIFGGWMHVYLFYDQPYHDVARFSFAEDGPARLIPWKRLKPLEKK